MKHGFARLSVAMITIFSLCTGQMAFALAPHSQGNENEKEAVILQMVLLAHQTMAGNAPQDQDQDALADHLEQRLREITNAYVRAHGPLDFIVEPWTIQREKRADGTWVVSLGFYYPAMGERKVFLVADNGGTSWEAIVPAGLGFELVGEQQELPHVRIAAYRLGANRPVHGSHDFLSRIIAGFSSIERSWEVFSVSEKYVPNLSQAQRDRLAHALRAYGTLRKDSTLSHDIETFLSRLNSKDFDPTKGKDRKLLHDLNAEIPPPPQATDAFVDWSNAEMVLAYQAVNDFLDAYLPQAKIPRWHYSFEHLRLAQSLINAFLAPALANNPEMAAVAKSVRGLGLKFSEKAIDYVRVPYAKDRVTALKRLGFQMDTREYQSSGNVVFRHAHGMFYPIRIDFSEGQAVNMDEMVASVTPLRVRDEVDPEWLDMREVYDAVKAGLAGQVHILEDVPADVKAKAMEFLEKQHWPELEMVEDHVEEWAAGKFQDTLAKAMPDLQFALRPEEIPSVEVGVRVGDLGIAMRQTAPQEQQERAKEIAAVQRKTALLHVYRPTPQANQSRLAYVSRIGDTTLYNGFVEGALPKGFPRFFFGTRLHLARFLTNHQLPFLYLMGPVRLAKLLRWLVGQDWARTLFIEYPDQPWLAHTPMGQKFRERVDGLLGPGAWKYFVDHRTIRFTGEVQRSLWDRIFFSPRRNDFDTTRETLRILGFQERERYNPLNTDWEAQVVWIPDHAHSSFFLDKPLDGMRGKVALFSAIWRSLYLFGVNPPPRTYAPPLEEDKWQWEDIGPRIDSALRVQNASDRRYLLIQWQRWLSERPVKIGSKIFPMPDRRDRAWQPPPENEFLFKVEQGLKETPSWEARLADVRRFLKATLRSLLLPGPTPYVFHHMALEGVFEEIGANLSHDADTLATRKSAMTPEEINSGFIARFSKKVSRRQAFSLESRVLQPWLLTIPYLFGRLSREEVLSLYEDASRHNGRVMIVEGPHYENIDRRAGMHKFDQGKVDIAIKTASEGKSVENVTTEGWGTRLVSAAHWLYQFYGKGNRDSRYWKGLQPGTSVPGTKVPGSTFVSAVSAVHPAAHPADKQPIEVWVRDAGAYRAPSHWEGLSVQIKQKEGLADFGKDESGGAVVDVPAVIVPQTEAQVAEVFKRFSAATKPLTVGAANTGLSRGAVPSTDGEEVISTRALRQIIAPDGSLVSHYIGKDDDGQSFAVVAPGTPLMDFQNAVESQGLYYPPDPTERSSLIGGNVATNASGPRTFKYGPTRDWVRALRVVLANGDVLDLRRGKVQADANGQFHIHMSDGSTRVVQIPDYTMPHVKNAAGYYAKPGMDLIDLFIGSEGTLGVITQVEVGLIPKPAQRYSGNVYFPSERQALNFVFDIRSGDYRGITPSLLEYFDETSVAIMRAKNPRIDPNAKAAVYFEQEISDASPESLRGAMDTWQEVMAQQNYGALNIQEATDDKTRAELRDLRHSVPEEVNRRISTVAATFKHPYSYIAKVATDIAVPDDKFDAMMVFYKQRLAQAGFAPQQYAIWGHIGNNHVHVNMIPENPAQYEKAKELLLEFARKAAEFGGTVTAEHGVGKIKVPQWVIMVGQRTIVQMAAVKKVLDPAGILGRGTMFPPRAMDIPKTPTGGYMHELFLNEELTSLWIKDQMTAKEHHPGVLVVTNGSAQIWTLKEGRKKPVVQILKKGSREYRKYEHLIEKILKSKEFLTKALRELEQPVLEADEKLDRKDIFHRAEAMDVVVFLGKMTIAGGPTAHGATRFGKRYYGGEWMMNELTPEQIAQDTVDEVIHTLYGPSHDLVQHRADLVAAKDAILKRSKEIVEKERREARIFARDATASALLAAGIVPRTVSPEDLIDARPWLGSKPRDTIVFIQSERIFAVDAQTIQADSSIVGRRLDLSNNPTDMQRFVRVYVVHKEQIEWNPKLKELFGPKEATGGYMPWNDVLELPRGPKASVPEMVDFAQKIVETAKYGSPQIAVDEENVVFEYTDSQGRPRKDVVADSPFALIFGQAGLERVPLITQTATVAQATEFLDWVAQTAKLARADPFANGTLDGLRAAWNVREVSEKDRLRVKAITLQQFEKDFADPGTAKIIREDIRNGVRYAILTPRGEKRETSLRRLARGNITDKNWIFGPNNRRGILHLVDAVDGLDKIVDIDLVVEKLSKELRVALEKEITPDVWMPFVAQPEKVQDVAGLVVALDQGMQLTGKNRTHVRYLTVRSDVRTSEVLTFLHGLFTLPLKSLVQDPAYRKDLLAAGFTIEDLNTMKIQAANELIPPSLPQTGEMLEKASREKRIADAFIDWTT